MRSSDLSIFASLSPQDRAFALHSRDLDLIEQLVAHGADKFDVSEAGELGPLDEPICDWVLQR
jgi:hypothetical protein